MGTAGSGSERARAGAGAGSGRARDWATAGDGLASSSAFSSAPAMTAKALIHSHSITTTMAPRAP